MTEISLAETQTKNYNRSTMIKIQDTEIKVAKIKSENQNNIYKKP